MIEESPQTPSMLSHLQNSSCKGCGRALVEFACRRLILDTALVSWMLFCALHLADRVTVTVISELDPKLALSNTRHHSDDG